MSAVAATAHGLFEVARAAGVPWPIACTYPVITDGLALVAYAGTNQLGRAGRAYAWAVLVIAAGLSGLAQAVYLGGLHVVPDPVRYGAGAWPAVAAAVAAHLCHLLREHGQAGAGASDAPTPGAVGRGLVAGPTGALPAPVRDRAPAGPEALSARTNPTEDHALPAPTPEDVARASVTPVPASAPIQAPHGDRVGKEEVEEPRRVTAPLPVAAPPAHMLDTRAAELIAAGAGRRTLARELGVSEHEARKLQEAAKASRPPVNGRTVVAR